MSNEFSNVRVECTDGLSCGTSVTADGTPIYGVTNVKYKVAHITGFNRLALTDAGAEFVGFMQEVCSCDEEASA